MRSFFTDYNSDDVCRPSASPLIARGMICLPTSVHSSRLSTAAGLGMRLAINSPRWLPRLCREEGLEYGNAAMSSSIISSVNEESQILNILD